jgi:hypothetical protein
VIVAWVFDIPTLDGVVRAATIRKAQPPAAVSLAEGKIMRGSLHPDQIQQTLCAYGCHRIPHA